jgi:hypothetical protein
MIHVALIVTAIVAAASNEDHGKFASMVITAGCTSPVGICTAGTLTGGLKGSFEFTATSLVPTADTPSTSVLLYTGDIVVHTDGGDLLCKDAGAFESTGDGAVSSVCHITGGTGDFVGAQGQIQFVGTFTFAAGGNGDYRAVLDVP